jgi:hypothetical protein
MVFGSNWTQVGPKFLSKRLVVSGLPTNLPELGSASRGWAGNVVWPDGAGTLDVRANYQEL